MLLQIDNVTLTLIEQQRLLFHPFNTSVNAGEHIMFLGESGQGKTSLLRIIAKLDSPSAGQLHSPIVKKDEHSKQGRVYQEDKITQWRRHYTYVAQQAVMQKGTIEDNFMLPFLLHNKTYDQAKALHYMNLAGLSHLSLTHNASTCSGGEQQRIALIRALLLDPSVLLLDEVTSALDEQNTLLVEQMLQTWLHEGNHAIIWISHHRKQVQRLASQVWYVKDHSVSIYSRAEWLQKEEELGDELTNA